MKVQDKRGTSALTAFAGLTVAATMVAVPLAGAAADEVSAPGFGGAPDPAGAAAQVAEGALVQGGIVKAQAAGVFSYSQDVVSSQADLQKFRGATQVLCGAADASRYANPLAWEITVSGDVEHAFTAPVEELVSEQSVNRLMTCSCGGNPAGGRAIATADVKGIPIEHLLARAGASAEANTVTFVSVDGTCVSMPIGYVVGRHGVLSLELNGADLAETVGGANQLWLAKTPANYFLRDIVEVIVSTESELPPTPGATDEHPNSPNAGILEGVQV